MATVNQIIDAEVAKCREANTRHGRLNAEGAMRIHLMEHLKKLLLDAEPAQPKGWERAASRYSIELSDADFVALSRFEGYERPSEEMYGPAAAPFLSDQLDRLPGVRDSEYNGHYGAFIYLHLDADEDTTATKALIDGCIEAYLAEVRAWAAKHPKKA